jgi:hypothetical protein
MRVTPLLVNTISRFPSARSEDTKKQAAKLTLVVAAIVDKAQSIPQHIIATRCGGDGNYTKGNE